MKFTNNSNQLISFFVKHNCIPAIKHTKNTNAIFTSLYHEINNGFKYIDTIKNTIKLTMHHERLKYIEQIPKPVTFSFNDFPNDIKQYIDTFSVSSLTYSLHLFNKDIKIIFILEQTVTDSVLKCYNKYVDNMLVWLYIIVQYSSIKCATNITIFIYHIALTKQLPKTGDVILNQSHVNTAFTRTCPINSEIIIFRKEEWFKVFIHETFHNFGLDFSNMKNADCHSKILDIFPVKSEVNLFEAYAEYWARTINVLFCSFHNMTHKHNIADFLINAEFLMNYERIYSFFQMVKVLDYMNMSYATLYDISVHSSMVRQKQYNENTSVLAYYVITLILINNYQDFLLWCNDNNTSLFQFNQTIINQTKFCKFIEKKYKIKNLLEGVKCTEKLLDNITQLSTTRTRTNTRTKTNNSINKKDILFILNNLRMSMCELC